MSEFITLIVPPGAESAAISHGTEEFIAYQAAHLGHSERWLVDVPREAAQALLHNGGFKMAETETQAAAAAPDPGGDRVMLKAPSAASASSYEDAGDGFVWVPAALAGVLVESHGFKVSGAAGEMQQTDAALAARTAQVAEAEERHADAIKAMSVVIQDRDAKIADLDQRLASAVARSLDKDDRIATLEAHVAELEQQLAAATAAPAADDKAKSKG